MQVREEGIDRLHGATVWLENWFNMHLVYGYVKGLRWLFRNYVQGVFKKRPNFCYEVFIAHFPSF